MKTKQILALLTLIIFSGSMMLSAKDFRHQNKNGKRNSGEFTQQNVRGQQFRDIQLERFTELTDGEKENLKNLREAHQKNAKSMQLELQALKAAQKTMVESSDPEVKAIEKNVDQIARLEAQLKKETVAFRLEVKKILPVDYKPLRGRQINKRFAQAGPRGQKGIPGVRGQGQRAGNGQGQGSKTKQGAFAGQGNGQRKGNGLQGPNAGQRDGIGNLKGQGRRANMAQGLNGRGNREDGRRGFRNAQNGPKQGNGRGGVQALSLSDETKALLEKSNLNVSAENRDLRNQMHELQIKQKSLMSQEEVSLKSVNKTIDEMAKLKAQTMKNRVLAEVDMLKQLNPEEKEKVLLMKPKHQVRKYL